MIERDQRAVAVGAKTQGLPRRRAVAHRTEHLVAPEHELDWSAHGAGGNGTENLRSGHQTFGAEAAAEERTADVNLIGRYAEQSGKTPLRHRHTLTRRIDRERIALPRGNNRMRLHRIVILRRGLIGPSDRGFRRGELILDIAALRLRREAGADGLQREGFVGIKADPRRLGLVAWRKQACAFGRGFGFVMTEVSGRLSGAR